MAVTTSPIAQTAGVYNLATGHYVGTASGTVTIAGLGFTPRKIKVINLTTGTSVFDWIAGMGESVIETVTTAGPVAVPSAISVDYAEETVSGTGVYPPGTSGPGDGTLEDTSVVIESDVNPLTFQVVLLYAHFNLSADTFVYSIEG